MKPAQSTRDRRHSDRSLNRMLAQGRTGGN